MKKNSNVVIVEKGKPMTLELQEGDIMIKEGKGRYTIIEAEEDKKEDEGSAEDKKEDEKEDEGKEEKKD
jgi:hypothetical protein